MSVECIRRDLQVYFLQNYGINTDGKENERLLMHDRLFKARDLVAVVWDFCLRYGISVSSLPAYNLDITINGIAEYLGSMKE